MSNKSAFDLLPTGQVNSYMRLCARAGKQPRRRNNRSEPGKGELVIGQFSGLRKLQRGARRGRYEFRDPLPKSEDDAV